MQVYAAPHVGERIETSSALVSTRLLMSRPTWARGLNHAKRADQRGTYVAPHVGAWIETEVGADPRKQAESRPTWARGLKL